jgi:DNA-binding HxlR family transcriptional regulator
MDEFRDLPGLEAGTSMDTARALRASLDREERAAVEAGAEALFGLLGRAHALSILSAFAFAERPLRFGDIEALVDVAPNTLSARLSELTDVGLVERRAYDETPPRVEYSPTAKAAALFPAVGHCYRWAVEYEI